MQTSRWRAVAAMALLLVVVGLAFFLTSFASTRQDRSGNQANRLVVLVVFDQLRGDYLSRWQHLFEQDGFRRLTEQGAWFQNCHYPYSGTVTGPGHASLATGTVPAQHGIVSNEWYDRDSASVFYCASEPEFLQVPPSAPSKSSTPKKRPESGSPQRLLGPTLADAWRQAAGNNCRIVSLSSKDRGAVFFGGRSPNACYWLDTSTGNFVTSTFYRTQPHSWVKEFNQEHLADSWFGQSWTPCRSDVDYASESGPMEAPGRSNPSKMGPGFPHLLTGGLDHPGKEYYDALYTSPMANDLLLKLLRKAVEAEDLGNHEATDLLCVSFSANDSVGHAWGPDSPEVLDVTLRSDRLMGELLTFLDKRLGHGGYTVVLSADHGICPLVEVSRQQSHPEAQRVREDVFLPNAQEYLQGYYGKQQNLPLPIEKVVGDGIYLNQRWLREIGHPAGEVEKVLADWFGHQPGIQQAYTRSQLVGTLPANDALGKQVQLSFHPKRSGDVIIVLRPYCYLGGKYNNGTTHGSPHPYDTHVPLLVFGPDVKPGARQDLVTPQAAAAIMAQALGIKPPHEEYPVPAGLFVK